MSFSQIILSSPSPTESRRLFYTSVSLLLFRIQDYRYHPLQVIVEYWVEFLVLYSRFLLVIYFIYSSMYMSIPISQFVCPSIYLLAIIGIFLLHLWLFCSVNRFIVSDFFFFYILHISNIMWYLSFSVWLTSLSMIISRSVSVAASAIISFFFMAE